MARMVRIAHRDGREFAVTPADYRSKKTDAEGQTYEQQGFKIVRWEDGEPYEEPKAAEGKK